MVKQVSHTPASTMSASPRLPDSAGGPSIDMRPSSAVQVGGGLKVPSASLKPDTAAGAVTQLAYSVDPPGLGKSRSGTSLESTRVGALLDALGAQRLSKREASKFKKLIETLFRKLREWVISWARAAKSKSHILDHWFKEFEALFPQLEKLPRGQCDFLMREVQAEMSCRLKQVWSDKDPKQIAGFIKEFELYVRAKLPLERNEKAQEAFVHLSNCMLSAMKEATGQSPLLEANERLDLGQTLVPRAMMARYIYSSNGTVRVAKWKEEAQRDEFAFECAVNIESDIPRDPVWVNGYYCNNFGVLISQLLAVGVPGDKIGQMASLFAQNSFNMMANIVTQRWPGSFVHCNLGRKAFCYDSETASFTFQAQLMTHSYSPLAGDQTIRCLYSDAVGHAWHQFYDLDFHLQGTFVEGEPTLADSKFTIQELLTEGNELAQDPSLASPSALCERLNNVPGQLLASYELNVLGKRYRALRDELADWQARLGKIEITFREASKNIEFVQGTTTDPVSGQVYLPKVIPRGRRELVKNAFREYEAQRQQALALQAQLQESVRLVYPRSLRSDRYQSLVSFIEGKQAEFRRYETFYNAFRRLKLQDLNSAQGQELMRQAREILDRIKPDL